MAPPRAENPGIAASAGTVAAGTVIVLIVYDWVPVLEAPSVTLIVNVLDAGEPVTVPEMVSVDPLPERDSPEGEEPLETLQVYPDPLPPEQDRLNVYACPIPMTLGSVPGVMTIGGEPSWNATRIVPQCAVPDSANEADSEVFPEFL